jgi:very-short-patch-repair endonuclease
VDFLVCCSTRLGFKWAILEIDGYWHFPQKRAKEHERERLFEHSGIRVYRLDAELCEKNPETVVSELIELMSK